MKQIINKDGFSCDSKILLKGIGTHIYIEFKFSLF